MKVVIAEAAKADLAAIQDYIAQDNPARAGSFTDELLDCCAALSETHAAFPLVPRYETSGIRRRVYDRYLIFYRVRKSTVEVIHILHGARDIDRLLFGENAGE
jgi:toxin ParE1/3/4